MTTSKLLDGKVAVVTGGASGIGRAVSIAFAAAGASVVINDIGVSLGGSEPSSKPAEETVAMITAAGGKAVACIENIATMKGGKRLSEAALDQFGRIDALACLAGISRPAAFEELSEEDWDAVIATHLKGHFSAIQPALAPMKRQKSGSIIAFTSTAGLDGSPPQANYAAAKAGILGLMRSLALSQAPYVRCNAVSPSARTRLIERIRPDYNPGSPEQITGLLTFLASDLSANITGQTIYARGNTVALYPQPRTTKTLTSPVEWTAESLAAAWEGGLGIDQLVRHSRYAGARKE